MINKIQNFIYRKIIDGHFSEDRILMKIFRKDFVKTLRVDMVDILAAQKIQEETFKNYKNCNAGKDLAIIATGPSLNNYKPIQNVINIGVNKALKKTDINYKYFFMQDYVAVKDYIDELGEERFKDTEKFFGIMQDYTYGGLATIPESVSLRLGAKRYCIFHQWDFFEEIFQRDISLAPLATMGTVAGSAIQFAIYTNPKRIYLVGIDCSSGHFDKNLKTDISLEYTIKSWKNFKEFARIWYPETEIISVNPVGLKGIFTDFYQE